MNDRRRVVPYILLIAIIIGPLTVFLLSTPKTKMSVGYNPFTLSLKSTGTDGTLAVKIHNVTKRTVFLVWDRYSHADLSGHFDFQVTDSRGNIVPETAFGVKVHTPDKPLPLMGGKPVSGANLKFLPDEVRTVQINLSKFVKLSVPGNYGVIVSYSPDLPISSPVVRSHRATVAIKSLGNTPALSTAIDSPGNKMTYTEGIGAA